jgi:cysteine desulfurase
MPEPEPTAYLDHAASTPLRPEALEAMAPFVSSHFANASGSHRGARAARQAVEEAREQVAEAVGAAPAEVVFTAGGTEADNLAVLGSLAAAFERPGPVGAAFSAVEHPAVLEPMRAAARGAARVLGVGGVDLHEVPVRPDGVVDLDALADALSPTTALVSVMAANNEVGTVQPLGAVVAAVRRLAPDALVHTDAVQAAGWLDLPTLAGGCDLVSLSAHKLGGPKGVGALIVRGPARIAPLLHGGGQEQERRSGTHNVAGIVGFGAAISAAVARRPAEAERLRCLRDRFAEAVSARVQGTTESVERRNSLPGHCHLRFAGVEQEELLVLLDQGGVAASAGSACASGAIEPSPVLLAMGVPAAEARTGIRFTLGHTTSLGEVDHAVDVVAKAVETLRR